jgi:hypothetical protein
MVVGAFCAEQVLKPHLYGGPALVLATAARAKRRILCEQLPPIASIGYGSSRTGRFSLKSHLSPMRTKRSK